MRVGLIEFTDLMPTIKSLKLEDHKKRKSVTKMFIEHNVI